MISSQAAIRSSGSAQLQLAEMAACAARSTYTLIRRQTAADVVLQPRLQTAMTTVVAHWLVRWKSHGMVCYCTFAVRTSFASTGACVLQADGSIANQSCVHAQAPSDLKRFSNDCVQPFELCRGPKLLPIGTAPAALHTSTPALVAAGWVFSTVLVCCRVQGLTTSSPDAMPTSWRCMSAFAAGVDVGDKEEL
jgi:hypothetical protein